jgi:hypothetical protein
MWVYEMYKKFDKAFIEAAEADPEWIEAEESIVVQDG